MRAHINAAGPSQLAFEPICGVNPRAPTVFRIRVLKPAPSVINRNATVREGSLGIAYYEAYSHRGDEDAIPKDHRRAAVIGAKRAWLEHFLQVAVVDWARNGTVSGNARAATSRYRIAIELPLSRNVRHKGRETRLP